MRTAKAHSRSVLCLFALLGFAISLPVQSKNFVGYTGKTWNSDFGVLRGQCDAKLVQAESLKGQLIEQMAYVEGQDAFRKIFPPTQLVDSLAVDSHCFGHTMELVPSGQAVRWLNPVSGVGVYLSPGAKSDSCRSYLGVTVVNGEKKKFRGDVCSPSKGVWQIQQ
ncbi:MAG TPA: hypothetical protein VFV28_03230 [Limnobacter sp.]|nr:hypothetical protein [Limnobacter sp.]